MTNMVSLYGHMVDSSSEEWKTACEARAILTLSTPAERASEIEMRAKKRGGSDKFRVDVVRAGLQRAVTVEWQWRRDQRAQAMAA